jgi:hypothetical protein
LPQILTPDLLTQANKKLKKPEEVLRRESSIKDKAMSSLRKSIVFERDKAEEHRKSEEFETAFDVDNEVSSQEIPRSRHDSGIDSSPNSPRSSLNSPLPSSEKSPLTQSLKTSKSHNVVDLNTNTASSYTPTVEFNEGLAKRRKGIGPGDLSDTSDTSSDTSDSEE